jgi:16S rRNA (cytidine1402-2'-O)-methyltransferase
MVGTPIGNLEDITLRALETLREVDVIACEDTRHTQRLLQRYDIKKRLIACHAHNELQSAEGILKLLDEGSDVAFVSDAGTPGISDPGSRLVSRIMESEHEIIPIPGVSALTTLASVSGLIGKTLVFEGFLSPKSGKRSSRLQELLERNEACVLYESPFRILKVLDAIREIEPERSLCVGREMTKAFEEFVRGTAEEIYQEFSSRQSIKGEFALMILPRQKKNS